MDEELYRVVSTGLLGLIVLLLVAVLARLGRLQRGASASPADTAPVHDDTPPPSKAQTVAPNEDGGEPGGAGDQEEGPFERDGRWWFRREGQLLVYDELSEEWVDPNAPRPVAAAPSAPVTIAGVASGPDETAVVPAPDAPAEPTPHPLDEARGWDSAPASGAPIPEPVSPPEPIATGDPEPARHSQSAAPEVGAHWKCPTCGVINGSTATSCRMCFAARP